MGTVAHRRRRRRNSSFLLPVFLYSKPHSLPFSLAKPLLQSLENLPVQTCTQRHTYTSYCCVCCCCCNPLRCHICYLLPVTFIITFNVVVITKTTTTSTASTSTCCCCCCYRLRKKKSKGIDRQSLFDINNPLGFCGCLPRSRLSRCRRFPC